MENYNTTTTTMRTTDLWQYPTTTTTSTAMSKQQPFSSQHITSLDGEPAFPTTPVLSLELENISKLSKGGREGLSYMWSVFSRCKESIRDGRRLENLSWRLWYEDLKSTGCVANNLPSTASTSSLSDPESECDSTDDEEEDDENSFEDVVEQHAGGSRQGQSEEKVTNSSRLSNVGREERESDKLAEKVGASSSSLGQNGSAERRSSNAEPDTIDSTTQSRGRSLQGREAKHLLDRSETKKRSPASQAPVFSNPDTLSCSNLATGTAFDDATLLSSTTTSAAPQPPHSSISSTPLESGNSSTTTTGALSNNTAIPPPSSPSKHIRRSSCPASRNRETLRISRLDGTGADEDHQHNHTSHSTMMTKKEKRALSFANTHRPTGGGGRLARAMPPLTPETIQDIIGTVLPMDFKKSPRVRLTSSSSTTSPTLPSSNKPTSPTIPSPTLAAPTSASQAVPAATPANATVTVPTSSRPVKAEHTREPSIKSERSYFTSTTATSELGVDPVFSPPLDSLLVKQNGGQQQHHSQLPELVAHDATTSAPPLQPVASTSEIPYTSPRLTQSEETRELKTPSPDSIAEEEEGAEQDGGSQQHQLEARAPSPIAPTMKRNSSSHKVAVKPALLTRGGKNSASSSKLNRSALQRTQSAKSVRILESPTEADGAALDVATSGESSTAAHTALNATSHHHANGKHVAKHTVHAHSHIAPKRTMSSARLKGHVRNGSSISLHKEARTKSPTLPEEQEKTERSPLPAVIPAQVPAQLQPVAPAERREMQAAPHVTKAINIRRNNSSLANIIKAEPRSVSRGFAVPGQEAGERETTQQDRAASHSPPSSDEMAAVNAAAAQSAPDAPALHPPPPSPASPVVMVPCSVILPPQPRPSPADPRFRVHSTTRRPRSPPIEELERADPFAAAAPPRQHQQQARTTSMPTKAEASPLPPNASQTTAPRDMRPEPQQLTNAKKKQMFFLSSPGTDSDDEHGTSFKRMAVSAVMNSVTAPASTETVSSPRKDSKASEKEKNVEKPAIKVVQVTSPTEQKEQKQKDGNQSDDDEDYEDEDDSDWSSEASESEDEHQAAIRREEERQRLMFAKRTPSMVANQGGLLSKILRPEEYSRGFANMPGHLRDNKSAMHLNQLPNIGGTAGIERARAANALLTVTGLQASKSTAALPDLKAAETSRLVPSKSGNHLTRLGGAPSGVELESDDDDDDEQAQDISPTQEKKLAALMQRTTSSQARPRAGGPAAATQHSPPRAEVSRITSAAQIAMQPEVQPTNILTPRTTRRNMLSTELTESLRASLLAERNRNRPAAGIGRLVSAVGSRLGVRQQQPDSAPSQIEAPVAQPPPRLQRGSTGFAPANANGPERARPGPSRASTARLPNTRANSDPPQTEYYSPGFHHTGW